MLNGNSDSVLLAKSAMGLESLFRKREIRRIRCVTTPDNSMVLEALKHMGTALVSENNGSNPPKVAYEKNV